MASVRRCEEWHNLSVNVRDDCRERRRNAGHSMREKMVLLTRTASETDPIAFLRSFYKGEQQLHGYDAEGSDSNHCSDCACAPGVRQKHRTLGRRTKRPNKRSADRLQTETRGICSRTVLQRRVGLSLHLCTAADTLISALRKEWLT